MATDYGLTRRRPTIQEDLETGIGPGAYIPGDQGIDLLREIPPSEFQAPSLEDGFQAQRPQMPTERPREAFRQGIANQLIESERAFKEGQAQRGVVDVGGAERFRQRGFMVAGQEVAKTQYKDAIDAENQVIEHLTSTAGIRDKNQLAKMQQGLRTKFNNLRTELAKQAHKFNIGLTNSKADQAKKLQYYQMLGGIAQTAGFAAASGGTKPKSQAEVELGKPEVTRLEGGTDQITTRDLNATVENGGNYAKR